MTIIACGINHKTAPLALREKVAFSLEKIPLYLHDLAVSENIAEAVLLSTCNRSELYCKTKKPEALLLWFCRQHNLSLTELKPVFYFHQDFNAVKHMMKVACGLDSMVLGESQILGQMKTAFSESCAAGMVGSLFNRLFQHVFAVAKEVRTNTSIGACPMSIASTAIRFLNQHLSMAWTQACVTVIGAGVTAELVLRHLTLFAPKKITLLNRTETTTEGLVKKFNAHVKPFSKLSEVISESDVVISATGSLQPIMTKNHFSYINKEILLMDLAVPRDIDPLVSELKQIKLFSIDDLRETIQENLKNREHAETKAHELILQRCQDFMTWQSSIDLVNSTIRVWRQHMELICQKELNKALQQLQRGDNPTEVLHAFSYAFMQKVLHMPSVQLREAGFSGRKDLLELAQTVFAVPVDR